ncbi:MAG: GrdX protein [Tissierellia bacterium]|nr:GrdX protein [Tissierellia bacterium]
MIITNNDWVLNKYKESLNIVYIDGTFKDVLIAVRDKLHLGHELLTHPLASSVKPSETPYKSIMISDEKKIINFNSVYMIENAIITYDKFDKEKLKFLDDKSAEDLKLVDLTVLESALNI